MSNSQGKDFVTGLQDAARENPVAAALVGMGLVWMLTGGNRITAAAAMLAPVARAATDGIGRSIDVASDATAEIGEKARSVGTRAVEQSRDAIAGIGETAAELGAGAFNVVKRGVSATQYTRPDVDASRSTGTAMAAALPTTKLESDVAGETADRLTVRAKELVSDTVDQVKKGAARGLDAVKEEAIAQGLTVDDGKAGIAALGDRVKAAAKRASTAAADPA
jgi:hypothetical protein